jgi:lipoprotein-anchoring transpeptidase ErfK/SrfK
MWGDAMSRRTHSRRSLAGVVVLLMVLVGGFWLLPGHLSATSEVVYFDTTGHYLSDEHGFLGYWREHDGARLLGNPITGAFQEDGRTVQYFERGRLEHHPERADTPVMAGLIGVDYTRDLWRTFTPVPMESSVEGEQFFAATRHTLADPFLSFWEEHGSLATFGYPISEPLWEYVDGAMMRVQYFERGRLEHHPTTDVTANSVRISSLGTELARLRGLDMSPAPAPTAAPLPTAPLSTATPAPMAEAAPAPEAAPAQPAAPAPAPQPAAAPAPQPQPAVVSEPQPAPVSSGGMGGKYIVVSLADQWLYAYEGDVMVFDAPISTGRDGFNTPAGAFSVYSKVPSQTMSGTIGGESYSVPNVPHAMYINADVAMHGTYWHNQFGTGVRRSHGCINLPLNSAAWLYNWAPVGTPVQVQ